MIGRRPPGPGLGVASLAVALLGVVLPGGAACDDGDGVRRPRSLAEVRSAGGVGPEAIYLPDDPDSTLFPFPHDALTRADPGSPTGVRLVLPAEAETEISTKIRLALNEHTGFDPLTPLQLSFDAPVDLDTLRLNRNPDPGRHSLFVFNVDPSSSRFGSRVDLDFAGGHYPVLRPPRSHFPNDALGAEPQYVFAPGNREAFYEDATDTLWVRPVVPMAAGAVHAVIVTRRVRGEDGAPVRSPHAPDVALSGQIADLDRALPLLDALGVEADEVAWAYTVTTGTPIAELERVHDGLVDGRGPLAYLHDRFPPRIDVLPVSTLPGDDVFDLAGNDLLLDPAVATEVGRVAIPLLGADADDLDPAAVDQLVDFTSVAYMVQGTLESPFFLSTPARAFDPRETDGRIRLDARDVDEVPWFLSVPRPTERNGFATAPYPVCIFQHPSSTSRLVAVAVASVFADHGFAVVGIDAAENGPILPFATDGLLDLVADPIEAIPLVDAVAVRGRTPPVDANGDGRIRSGEGTFTADLTTVRDVFRQTSIDLMQLTRVLRALGTDHDGDGILGPAEGDFDGDGTLDVGGPDAEIVIAANSLGTLMAGPFLALTREIDRAAFNVPGGGAMDLLTRIDFATVDQIFKETFGPAVVGRPAPEGGGIEVTLIDDLGDEAGGARLGPYPVPGGAFVHLANRSEPRTEERRVRAGPDGSFLVTVPADPGDRLELRWSDPAGGELDLPTVRLAAERHGFGVERNSPELRAFLTVAQNAAGPADPAHYAVHWALDPLPGRARKRVLLQADPDDVTVPTSMAITLGRSAGLIGPTRMRELIEAGIVVGNIPAAGIRSAIPALPLPPGEEGRYPDLDYDLSRTFPFEEPIPGSGFVLHHSSNHEYLFAPSVGESGPVGAWLTLAAQSQMALFLTEGRIVVDFRELIDALRARGRTIAPIPGVDP